MRRTVIVAGCLAAAATRASADTSIHALLDGDVAVTDNVFSGPSGDPTDPREADVYFVIQPGVLFAYNTPRMIQELTASLQVLEYVRSSSSPSLTYRADWRAFYQPTPLTEVLTEVIGSTGTINALTAQTAADQIGATAIVPGGTVHVDQLTATEHLAYHPSEATRLSENVSASLIETDDGVGDTLTAYEASATVAYDHLWQATSLGAEAGVDYLHFDRTLAVESPLLPDADHELNPHLYAVVRHDFSRHWTANANAGVVLVIPTQSDRTSQLFPVASAQVGYTDDWGQAFLQIGRTIAPNLFIAENTIVDGAAVTVNLPLPWLRGVGRLPSLFGQSSIGVSRTQLIDASTGDEVATLDLERADLGVSWLARPGMTFGLRYEFIHQSGNAPVAAALLIPTFTRDTVFLTFAIRWPATTDALIPKRTGMRADGRDLTPIGDEIGVPTVAAPAANGTSNGAPGPEPAP